MSTLPKDPHRKLIRVEQRNSAVPIEIKPSWIRTRAQAGENYTQMRRLSHDQSLHTVCAEAGCPNIYECWEDREASFLLGGALCTRRCDFCDIATGRPTEYDQDEPARIAQSVARLGLRYVTVTGVARDDLPDGAAWLYAETCRQIHENCPGTGVELLVDDFRGSLSAAQLVFDSAPEVFAHNLETVPRIFSQIRPAFRYQRSLDLLQAAAQAGLITKSNLILGFGESREEVEETMRDLAQTGLHLLTLTQYLRPSPLHHPVDRWVHPEEFLELAELGRSLGMEVMAGPLVRSSYRAGMLWAKAMLRQGRPIPPALQHLASQLEKASGVEGSAVARQEASAVLERLTVSAGQ